jgi:hypothetical protein
MWFAVDSTGQRIPAGTAQAGGAYTCPLRQPQVHTLIYRRAGPDRQAHFAHLPHSGCPWSTSVAGVRQGLVDSIVSQLPGCRIRYTRGGGSVQINERFWIELVTEPIEVGEWRARARAHNERGDPVIFLWDLALLGAVSFQELTVAYDPTLLHAMRVCQHASYTRLYFADRAGAMRGCRFFKVDGSRYRLGASNLLRWERPAIGAWSFPEGFRQPLSRPLWHLFEAEAIRPRPYEERPAEPAVAVVAPPPPVASPSVPADGQGDDGDEPGAGVQAGIPAFFQD